MSHLYSHISKYSLLLLAALAVMVVFPDFALAGGIAEFSNPLKKVVDTVTGPAGKYISITAMAICGIIFIVRKDDIDGGFKLLLSVVFGISFICFATSIVEGIFGFGGAVL